MVRKYQNTIQNPYTAASAADASGSLQTALSKVTWPRAIHHVSAVLRRVTSDRGLTFLARESHKSDVHASPMVVKSTLPLSSAFFTPRAPRSTYIQTNRASENMFT